MRTEAIFFANNAAIDNWLLAVEGAGWEHFGPLLLPGTVSGYVAGILALDDSEHGELTTFGLRISDEDGHVETFTASAVAIGTRPVTAHGVPVRAAFAIPFMTAVSEPTVMNAELMKSNVPFAKVSCSVLGLMPDAPPEELG